MSGDYYISFVVIHAFAAYAFREAMRLFTQGDVYAIMDRWPMAVVHYLVSGVCTLLGAYGLWSFWTSVYIGILS